MVILMPRKNRESRLEYQREYWREHKEEGKQYHEARKEYYRNYHKEWLKGLKVWAVNFLGNKCFDCGLQSSHMDIYDFHHENGEESWSSATNNHKSYIKIKQLVQWKNSGKIPKNVFLLCANCHRIRHED